MLYRVRDLLLPPGLLSLCRIPLAVVFPFVVGSPVAALGVLAAAGVSDVLDGWVARRFGLATPTGAALDPVTDKIFVLTVALTLMLEGYFSIGAVLLLSVRELAELPLVVWLAASPAVRTSRVEHPKANLPGKLVTLLQFVSVGSSLLGAPHTGVWLGATAVAGLFAAASYWRRARRDVRS